MEEIARADLVIRPDGFIVKDRHGHHYRARDLARVERLAAADIVDGTVCRWTSTTDKGTEYLYVAL